MDLCFQSQDVKSQGCEDKSAHLEARAVHYWEAAVRNLQKLARYIVHMNIPQICLRVSLDSNRKIYIQSFWDTVAKYLTAYFYACLPHIFISVISQFAS